MRVKLSSSAYVEEAKALTLIESVSAMQKILFRCGRCGAWGIESLERFPRASCILPRLLYIFVTRLYFGTGVFKRLSVSLSYRFVSIIRIEPRYQRYSC